MSTDFDVGAEKPPSDDRGNYRVGILGLAVGLCVLVAFFFSSLSARRMTGDPPQYIVAPPAMLAPAPVATPAHTPLSSGVKMANEMGRADYDLVQKLNLASEADPALCIYNAVSSFDEPEMAVLTAKRISYVKEGRITPMDLSGIETILDHRKYMEKYQQNGYASDQFNIEIKGKDGSRMRVVVRPGADGPSFYEALNDAWKAAGGGEKPAEAAPQAP